MKEEQQQLQPAELTRSPKQITFKIVVGKGSHLLPNWMFFYTLCKGGRGMEMEKREKRTTQINAGFKKG